MSTPQQHGILFILSGPSGSGKSTITHELLASVPGLAFSVSHTTRKPRPDERDGVDYHFVDRAAFLALRDRQPSGFLEWAEVHGELYGTSVHEVKTRLRQGQDILLDIDVQGARQILDANPEAVSIFLCPPSMDVLRARLQQRASETSENFVIRLRNAHKELRHAPDYRYIIVNDELAEAIAAFRCVITAERLKARRRPDGKPLPAGLW